MYMWVASTPDEGTKAGFTGGRARSRGATASTSEATARLGWCGEPRGRHGYPRARARSDGSADTIACRWGWPAVVTRQLLIGSFELKFDCLNTNSANRSEKLTVFIVSGPKNLKKILKIVNFILHPINTPYDLSLFHTHFITFLLSSLFFYT
jgi:hypothetical protein